MVAFMMNEWVINGKQNEWINGTADVSCTLNNEKWQIYLDNTHGREQN